MRRPGLAYLALLLAALGGLVAFVLRPSGPDGVETEEPPTAADRAGARPATLDGLAGRGRAGGTQGPLAAEASGARDPAAPARAGPTRVEGRVLDETGRPIEGARVTAVGAPAPAPTTLTDADGRYALSLPPPGTFPLRIEVPGGETLDAVALAGAAEIVASRTPTFPIAGRVVDAATGEGVGGVPVTARPAASPDGDGPTATTAANGAFVVGVRVAATYVLHVGARALGDGADAAAAAYVPARVDGVATGTTDVVVRLTTGLAIEGRVLDDAGDLVARPLRVDVVGRTARGDPDWSRRRAVRLPDGALKVPGLAPGRYDVWVRPEPGKADTAGAPLSAGVRRDVEAGATGVEVRLARGLVLAGRVVDAHGDPVTGRGEVVAMPEGATDRNLAVRADVPGDGTFLVGPLDGAARFDLVASGFAGRREAVRRGVSPRDADVTLTLEVGGRIAGRVVGKDGAAVPAGVPVGVLAREVDLHGGELRIEGTRAFAYTAADGSFVADGLGAFRFDLEAGGGRSGFLGTIRESIEVGATDVVLEVVEGVEVAGTLVDDAGAPTAATSLQADDGARRAAMRPYVQVGPDGRFRFRGLKAGAVRFSVRVGEAWIDVGAATAPSTDVKLTVPRS